MVQAYAWLCIAHSEIQASWQVCHLHRGAPAPPLGQRRSRRQKPGIFPSMHCPALHSLLAEAWSHGHNGCKGGWERQLYARGCSSTALVVVLCSLKEVSPWPTLYRSPYNAFPDCCPAPLPSEGSSPSLNP